MIEKTSIGNNASSPTSTIQVLILSRMRRPKRVEKIMKRV